MGFLSVCFFDMAWYGMVMVVVDIWRFCGGVYLGLRVFQCNGVVWNGGVWNGLLGDGFVV